MMASAEPLRGYHSGLTIAQVASMLKVSPSTARRWVRAGRLPSTQVTAGDGFEYRVPMEALEDLEASTGSSAKSFTNDSTPLGLEASMERSTAMAAYNAQLLAPLVAVIERQADQLVSQAGTIGRLEAENQALRAAQASGEPPTPERRLWARLWPLVAVLVLVVAGMLLAWPR